MRILGIDPGTKCGWALRDPDGNMVSGVWNLAVGRHESAGMRYIRLRGFLNEIYKATPFELLAYEEVARHAGTHAAHIYGGIVAVIQSWCVVSDCWGGTGIPRRSIPIDHTAIPVGTIKKFATGKGNANKDKMTVAAHEKWPGVHGYREGWLYDEADARWIAECAASQLRATQ